MKIRETYAKMLNNKINIFYTLTYFSKFYFLREMSVFFK